MPHDFVLNASGVTRPCVYIDAVFPMLSRNGAREVFPDLETDANTVRIFRVMMERNVLLECAVSAAGVLVTREEAVLSVPDFTGDHEVWRYLRGLREWIAGFVNWLYETGNEVRAFGWVFVLVEPQTQRRGYLYSGIPYSRTGEAYAFVS